MLSFPPFFLPISLVCFAGREQQRANKRSCNVYALFCRLEEEEKSLTFLTNSCSLFFSKCFKVVYIRARKDSRIGVFL